jgi:hypothetical protein
MRSVGLLYQLLHPQVDSTTKKRLRLAAPQD